MSAIDLTTWLCAGAAALALPAYLIAPAEDIARWWRRR